MNPARKFSVVPNTTTNKTVQVRPGFVVCNATSARGGVSYQREEIDTHAIGTDGEQRTFTTKKRVDHKAHVALTEAIQRAVYNAIKKHCTQTVFGWYADQYQADSLRVDIERLQAEARAANAQGRLVGSARQIYVNVVNAKLDLSTPETLAEIQRTVVETLEDMHERLSEGDIRNVISYKNKNLPKLVTGSDVYSLEALLTEAKETCSYIQSRVNKDGEKLEDVLTEAAVVACLDNLKNQADYFRMYSFKGE